MFDNIKNIDLDAIQENEPFIPFEEDYLDIKDNRNDIWLKYEDRIIKVVNRLAYWKNFDHNDLLQQSYLFFIQLCNAYDPYYMGNFIPFDKYLFKNLIMKLRAYIQRYYFKNKREQPTEILEYSSRYSQSSNLSEVDDKIYSEYLYSLITKRQRQILELSLKGYKQQEIGEILNISQSRVSVIKKKTLSKLNDLLENEGKVEKSRNIKKYY